MRFCPECGYAMVTLTPQQQVDSIYLLTMQTGLRMDHDPYMRGVHKQWTNWLSKEAKARTLKDPSGRPFLHAIHRAQHDTNFLLQQLEQTSMPPWFVHCMQLIWARKTPAQKAAAVTAYAATYAHQTSDGANPGLYYLPPILRHPVGDWRTGEYGDVTYKPIDFRGAGAGDLPRPPGAVGAPAGDGRDAGVSAVLRGGLRRA